MISLLTWVTWVVRNVDRGKSRCGGNPFNGREGTLNVQEMCSPFLPLGAPVSAEPALCHTLMSHWYGYLPNIQVNCDFSLFSIINESLLLTIVQRGVLTIFSSIIHPSPPSPAPSPAALLLTWHWSRVQAFWNGIWIAAGVVADVRIPTQLMPQSRHVETVKHSGNPWVSETKFTGNH